MISAVLVKELEELREVVNYDRHTGSVRAYDGVVDTSSE